MRIASRIKQRIIKIVTIIYIFLRSRNLSTKEKEITLLEEPETVYIFESDSDFLAQTTIVGSIIWNENKMNELSDTAKKLVLRHEVSHRDRNGIFKGLFFGSILWAAIGTIIILMGILFLIIGAPITEVGFVLITGLIMTLAFGILYRLDETLADYHALRDLGKRKYIIGHSELSIESNDSLLTNIQLRLFYTHPRDVIALQRAIQKFSDTK